MFRSCRGCSCTWDGQDDTPMSQNKFVAQNAFESLTEDEKNRVFSDVYGVGADVVEENPEFVERKIGRMKEALDKIPPLKKEGYLIALHEEIRQETNYVRSDKLILMFLRAERFHVAKAAKRMVKHFDHKMELFTIDKLPRSIVQDDLSEYDKESLNCGHFYVHEKMDHFGRPMMFINSGCCLVYNEIKDLFRVAFYHGLALAESNEDIQRLGIIVVLYAVDDEVEEYKKKEVYKAYKESRFVGSAPYRVACIHHCEAKNKYNVFTRLALTLYSVTVKARYQHHSGSHKEVRAKIQKFGIRTELLPVTATGKLDRETFLEPLRRKHRQEIGNESMITDSLSSIDDDDFSLGSY